MLIQILNLLLSGPAALAEPYKFETLLQRESVVWGFDFLKGGRIVFSERAGILAIFDPKTKKVTELKGAPKVWAQGQGGLLDVRVHPSKTDVLFFTYSEPVGDKATTALATAKFSGSELSEFKKLFSAHQPNSNDIHFGSRIEFDGAGHLFITVGDRDNRKRAQELSYHQGKILRLNEDGSVPKDNPFASRAGAKPEIYSYGHRNPQGLARHPSTGELWEAEMGPRGGDEVNFVKPGANYGWPLVTYGREYWGPSIGVKSKPGIEEPIVYWAPSISPSAAAFYSGNAFPEWKGNLFLGTLSGMHLRRLVLDGKRVVRQETLLEKLGLRFRNVRTGPDGYLYLSTDDGKIARLVPNR